jgi:hypothetical protein
MSVTRFRTVAAVLLCMHLGACTTWQPVQLSPREFIEAEAPYKIRFRDSAGAWLHVSYPRVEGDALSGTTPGRRPSDGRVVAMPMRMALADVLQIEAQRVNIPQTVLGVLAVGTVVVGAVMCATGVTCGRKQPLY